MDYRDFPTASITLITSSAMKHGSEHHWKIFRVTKGARPGGQAVAGVLSQRDPLVAGVFSASMHVILLALALLHSSSGTGIDVVGSQPGSALSMSIIESELDLRQKIERASNSELSPPPPPPAEHSTTQALESAGNPLHMVDISSEAISESAASTAKSTVAITETSSTGQPAVEMAAAGPRHGAGIGDASQADDARNAYLAAVRAAILSKWTDTKTSIDGCIMALEQEIGGGVLQAKVVGCSIDPGARDALQATALMVQPLPYVGYESVFSRSLEVELRR